MPILPGCGSPCSMRQRKSWPSSSFVGFLNDVICRPMRIDQAGRVPDHAALAGGVHALQHKERRSRVVAGAVRVEALLEVGQLVAEAGDGVLGFRLAAMESGVDRESTSASVVTPASASRSDVVMSGSMPEPGP